MLDFRYVQLHHDGSTATGHCVTQLDRLDDIAVRILGAVVGLFVGVIVDEQLFPVTEWTSAIVVPIFAIAGWFVAGLIVRRLRPSL